MISTRIKNIASFVTSDDTLLDVGCDHAYLAIYLKENNLCKNVLVSDISSLALQQGINNIKNSGLNIKAVVSDGFKNIEDFFDTAVISGMGTNTILKILNSKKRPSKLILQSNNDYYLLRKSLSKLNYVLHQETVVYENGKFYPIMLYKKGKEHLSYKLLMYGKSNNQEYFKYLLQKNLDIIERVPLKKRIILKYQCHLLKGLIEKK